MKRRSTTDTPSSLGYSMRAEWAAHAATWLGWPHNKSDWPGKFQPIPWVYAEIVRNLARHERVEILVQDAGAEEQARRVLDKANAFSENVRFHRGTTNRGWMRDSAPIFVKGQGTRDKGQGKQRNHTSRVPRPVSLAPSSLSPAPCPSSLAAVNFRFNAWAKYPDWQQDERASERIVKWAGVPAFRPEVNGHRVVLEGGSIDTNGRGLLLSTEECLLSDVQCRNPGLSRDDLETVLADYLGIEKVLWLERGIAGDDTHGHVDDITRFVAEDTVVTAVEPNTADENHEPLRRNLDRLRRATDIEGRKLQIVELPMPAPVVFQRRRLPASYANFYIANGVVLVPVFNDRNDRVALNILSQLFASREVVPIYCGDLIWGLGAIHCMTQQQPGC
ncbi:MAG: agmatine deiminase family protein [Terriglobales bacterium]